MASPWARSSWSGAVLPMHHAATRGGAAQVSCLVADVAIAAGVRPAAKGATVGSHVVPGAVPEAAGHTACHATPGYTSSDVEDARPRAARVVAALSNRRARTGCGRADGVTAIGRHCGGRAGCGQQRCRYDSESWASIHEPLAGRHEVR